MEKIVLLDTETTGGEERDRICQIAFLVIEGGNIEGFAEYCKPPLAISFEAMALHHITNERVAAEPAFEETESAAILQELNAEGAAVAIHNAPFDLGMIAKEGIVWQGPVVDTLRCARHLLVDSPRHALQYLRYARGYYAKERELAAMLGIKIAAHDAMGDVVVLKFLLDELLQKAGSVAALVALTKRPIVVEKMGFGKHKGRTITELVQVEKSYVEWLMGTELDEELRYTLRRALALEALARKERREIPSALEQKALRWAQGVIEELGLDDKTAQRLMNTSL